MIIYYVYILESLVDGTLYIGQTNNLRERIKKHNKKLIKSTKSSAPYKLRFYEEYNTRSEAMFREWELKKKWNTERKRKLLSSFDKTKLDHYKGL